MPDMPDIFVSYAREDHDWVSLFTTRLREEGGWDIWWDLKLLPGEQFDNAIESALDRARCVIVIWSEHSIDSRWVRCEAREGAQRGILVPLRIDDVTPPLEFRSFETPDMSKWGGDASDANFTEIVHVVHRAIDRTPAQTDADPSRRDRSDETAELLDARDTRQGIVRTVPGFAKLQNWATSRWAGVVGVAIAIVMGIGLATRGGTHLDPPVTSSFATSTMAPAAQLASTPRRLPELSYGTWTLRNAVDTHGGNWSNSTIKFTSQETTSDGLILKGTMTWRLGELLIGTERFSGRYVDASRQIYLEGDDVSDKRLALGSYSAVLSEDERSLLQGTWGSTAAPDQLAGVPGRWEASR
jgi:hypothetical protein